MRLLFLLYLISALISFIGFWIHPNDPEVDKMYGLSEKESKRIALFTCFCPVYNTYAALTEIVLIILLAGAYVRYLYLKLMIYLKNNREKDAMK